MENHGIYSLFLREIDEQIESSKKKKENNDFVLINIYIFLCIYIVLKILVYIRTRVQKMKSLKIHLVIETGISFFLFFLNLSFITLFNFTKTRSIVFMKSSFFVLRFN